MDSIADRLQRTLNGLGLDPSEVRDLTVIGRSQESRLYRLRAGGHRLVLKWQVQGESIEPAVYGLLQSLRVPTLPLHGRTDRAVLLDNLDYNPTWRRATERDMAYAETGRALAEWYQFLHLAGREPVAKAPPAWLKWPWASLTPESVRKLGEALELPHNPVWSMAARHLPALKEAAQNLPKTLNHNGFHWTNLALTRQGPPRAIVFDYHRMGIGLAWSDCRNVCSGLGPAAEQAYLTDYGSVDPRERILDNALAPLADLHAALAQHRFPPWARSLLDDVASGRLQKALERAVASL